MHTLFCIAYGTGITATLSLALPVDSTICFARNFILETDVRDVYALPFSEIVKQIQIELTIDPPKHQQHPTTLGCYERPIVERQTNKRGKNSQVKEKTIM